MRRHLSTFPSSFAVPQTIITYHNHLPHCSCLCRRVNRFTRIALSTLFTALAVFRGNRRTRVPPSHSTSASWTTQGPTPCRPCPGHPRRSSGTWQQHVQVWRGSVSCRYAPCAAKRANRPRYASACFTQEIRTSLSRRTPSLPIVIFTYYMILHEQLC